MNRVKKVLALLLSIAMLLSLFGCGGGPSSDTEAEGADNEGVIDSPSVSLVMGTAGAGGTWYVLGSAIASAVSKYTNINLTASSTNGTVDNMRLTGSGRLDIGMTQPPADHDAVMGQDLFEGESYDNLRWMCGGHDCRPEG